MIEKAPIITDEEIIGNFCKTCDYSLERCIEQGYHSTCLSYKEALRQKKIVAEKQIAKCHLHYLKQFVDWLGAHRKYYQSSSWGTEYFVPEEDLESLLKEVGGINGTNRSTETAG